jgi:hypothetical protein
MKDKRSQRNTKQFRKKVAERQAKARRSRLPKDSVIKYNPVTGIQESSEYKNLERNFFLHNPTVAELRDRTSVPDENLNKHFSNEKQLELF